MMLPYSVEVFFASMAEYYSTWFPAAPVAALLSLVALILVMRPQSGRADTGDRLAGALLAAAWIWVGAVQQLQHMANLDFMAPIYGAAWIAQGGLIALSCTVPGRVRFRFDGDARGRAGLALALLGLVGYPLAVWSLGYEWRALPLVGVAPHPTVMFTAGVLVAARDRPPLHLFVVPLVWAGVAGVSAWLLEFPLDYAVPAVVLSAAVYAWWSCRKPRISRI